MPQLILHIQLASTILGICEQYTIDSMVYLIENEVDRWHICLASTILGICEQYTIDSMVYLIENEVDRWHICLEMRMFGPLSRSRLSEDEIAEFVTKTEGKK